MTADEWIKLGVTLVMAFAALTGFVYRIKIQGDLTAQKVDRMQQDMNRGTEKFDALTSKLDDLSELMSSVKEDMAAVKTSVKYLENRGRNGRHSDG